MAKVIKGITVEIGGNASPLNKALNDVNKTSKSLQSELRTIDKLLKLDPTNVDLLKQKQDVLSESIENTEEKLRRLKSAEDKVAQAFEDGKIDAEQYRAFQRNIVTTEQKLNDLKSELDKTGQAFENLGTDAKKSEKKLDDYKKEVDDVKDAVSDLKDKAKDTALELGAGITAAGGAAAAAMMSFNSVDSALNHIQASTNLSKGQMDGFRNALEEIYNGNYGDDLSDIASKMANIVQYTNETDPDKIKDYAIKLFGLQDTFDLDFNETLRGTQGLIKNMGLTADQAFDFIASGAQNGLNYSGELSDNLSEYTSLFGQAGFTAEQMFAILDNGTESGTYNLDKVNDFVKEFTISLADGRIEENISSFSGGTSDLFKKWKDGKATAADVFYSVINDLSTAENKQTALTTASNVWSSLGEDNALNIITSLDDVNTKFRDVKGTMDEVNDIEYDDLGNRLEGLGRKVQTEIINPAVEDFYPEAEDFIDWVSDNLDDLITIVKELGEQVAIVWGVKKATDITKSVINLINTYKTLATVTNVATNAQKALNTTQKANVIGAITTVVLGLISAVKTYNEIKWNNSEAAKFAKEIDKIKDQIEETTKGITENLNNTLEDIDNIYADNTLIDDYQEKLEGLLNKAKLSPEEQSQLQTIVTYFSDNVKGFDETWKKYVEISDTGKVNLKGDLEEVQGAINKTIDDYQRLANSSALSELSTENSKNKISAQKELDEYSKQINNIQNLVDFNESTLDNWLKQNNLSWNDLKTWVDKSGNLTAEGKGASGIQGATGISYKQAIERYQDLISKTKELDKLKGTYNDSVGEMNKLIMTGDDLSDVQKVLNGDYSDAAAVMMAYNAGMINLEDVQKSQWKSISKLEKAAKNTGKNTVIGLVDGTKEYKGALVTNSNGLANIVLSEYDKVMEIHSPSEAMRRRGIYTVQGLIEGILSKNEDITKAARGTAENTQQATNIGGWFGLGGNWIGQLIGGIFGKNNEVEGAGETSAGKAKTGAGKVSLFSTGVSRVASFISGLFSDKNNPESAGEKVTDEVKTGSSKVSLFSIGNNLVSGFINGILSGEAFKQIGSAAMSVAENAYNAIKGWLGINSPAKKTIEIGEYFSEGFSLGIENEIESAEKSAEYLAENALSAMRARQKIINSFSQTNNDQNNMILPSVSTRIMAQTAAKSNNAPEVKQINLGGLTLKIEHFENRSAADVNKVTDQFMHAVENYVSRRDAFK